MKVNVKLAYVFKKVMEGIKYKWEKNEKVKELPCVHKNEWKGMTFGDRKTKEIIIEYIKK